MISQLSKIMITLLLAFSAVLVSAQEKIAVIDLQRVFDQSSAAAQEREKLIVD